MGRAQGNTGAVIAAAPVRRRGGGSAATGATRRAGAPEGAHTRWRDKTDVERDQWTQEQEGRVHDAYAKLNELMAGMSEDGFKRWLATLPRFHNFTFTNTLLICAQNPDATKVQSKSAWERHGRVVLAGELPLEVFVPRAKRVAVTDPNTGELVIDPETGKPKVKLVKTGKFLMGPEYDIAQTAPLPPESERDVWECKWVKNPDRSKTVSLVRRGPDTDGKPVVEETRMFPKTAPMGAWAEHRDEQKSRAKSLTEAALQARARTLKAAERAPCADPDLQLGFDALREFCSRRGVTLYRDGVDDPDSPDARSLRIQALLTDSNARGFYTEDESDGQTRKAIYVAAGAPDKQALHTVHHEVGHHVSDHIATGKRGETDRATEELEAEAFAYVMDCSLGIGSDYSPNYLFSWARGGDREPRTAVKDIAKRVCERAAATLTELDEIKAQLQAQRA